MLKRPADESRKARTSSQPGVRWVLIAISDAEAESRISGHHACGVSGMFVLEVNDVERCEVLTVTTVSWRRQGEGGMGAALCRLGLLCRWITYVRV